MTLSNIQGRGLLKGVLSKGGGGGGVTDYNQLSSKPQINGVTIENNHDGGYYGLIDSVDIEVTEIYEIGYGSNYDVNLNGAAVHVTNKIFKGATNSTNGTKGLVPAPAAGSVGKILSNEGWIDPPSYTPPNYSTSEQSTGQKWIDGKDIYFRTYQLDGISGNPSDWTLISNIPSADTYIRNDIVFYNTTTNNYYSDYYVRGSFNVTTKDYKYYITEMGSGSTGNLTATIYYTKN